MRAVVTRVAWARVEIDGKVNGAIDRGFLVLLGVGPRDDEQIAKKLAEKICNLRVFEDENGKMNLDLATVGGSLLVVSQFTLYADTSSRRPGFTGAAKPDRAIPLYEYFMDC
jgi:D-tyrosyl-tRNA(Tyr) deacylase